MDFAKDRNSRKRHNAKDCPLQRLNLKKDIVLCLVDFVKAFDRVKFSLLFKALQNRGVHDREIFIVI